MVMHHRHEQQQPQGEGEEEKHTGKEDKQFQSQQVENKANGFCSTFAR